MIELTILLLFSTTVVLTLVVFFQRDRIRELEKALSWERSRFAVAGDQEFFIPVNMAAEASAERREDLL